MYFDMQPRHSMRDLICSAAQCQDTISANRSRRMREMREISNNVVHIVGRVTCMHAAQHSHMLGRDVTFSHDRGGDMSRLSQQTVN